MTVFCCRFFNSQKQLLGVAIVELDESRAQISVMDVARECHRLGCNPGGAMGVWEISEEKAKHIKPEHKNRVVDEGLLRSLGIGRSKSKMQ